MGVMSGEFPGHSRAGNPLHSRNVLVLLELWHGARSDIKIYISLPLEYNAFTVMSFQYHESYPSIHVTIHFSQKRQSLLLMAP